MTVIGIKMELTGTGIAIGTDGTRQALGHHRPDYIVVGLGLVILSHQRTRDTAQHRFSLGNGTIGALTAVFLRLAVHRAAECHQCPDVLTDGFDEKLNPALFPYHNQCPQRATPMKVVQFHGLIPG